MNESTSPPQWYLMLEAEQKGPFSFDHVRELVAEGKADASTYVWKEGLNNWQPMSQVAELAAHLQRPPESRAMSTGSIVDGLYCRQGKRGSAA